MSTVCAITPFLASPPNLANKVSSLRPRIPCIHNTAAVRSRGVDTTHDAPSGISRAHSCLKSAISATQPVNQTDIKFPVFLRQDHRTRVLIPFPSLLNSRRRVPRPSNSTSRLHWASFTRPLPRLSQSTGTLTLSLTMLDILSPVFSKKICESPRWAARFHSIDLPALI